MTTIDNRSIEATPAGEPAEALTSQESVRGAWDRLRNAGEVVERARGDYQGWFLQTGGVLDQLVVMRENEDGGANGAAARLPDAVPERPGLLYVVLGGSIEPAVLIALRLRPGCLVFLHDNQDFGVESARRAQDAVTHVMKSLPRWCEDRHIAGAAFEWNGAIELLACDAANVPESFTAIEAHWKSRGMPASTAIAITGGKNPFVMAAFDFAALHNVPIWYEDFDSYDPAWGMPDPLTMKFRKLATPADVFRRYDLYEAFAAFDNGRFGEAARLINKITLGPGRLDPLRLQKATEYATFVAAWDQRRSLLIASAPDPPADAKNIAGPIAAMRKMWAHHLNYRLPVTQTSLEAAWNPGGKQFRPGLAWYLASELHACWRTAYLHEQWEVALLRVCACFEYLVKVQTMIDVLIHQHVLQRFVQPNHNRVANTPREVAYAVSAWGFELRAGVSCVAGRANQKGPQYAHGCRPAVLREPWRAGLFSTFSDNYAPERNALSHGLGFITAERFCEALDAARKAVLAVASAQAGAFEDQAAFATLEDPFPLSWAEMKKRPSPSPFVPKPLREVFDA